MWNSLYMNTLSGIGNGVGYGASQALAVETLIGINRDVFIPIMEKVDVEANRMIYGEEKAIITEQQWAYMNQEYFNPVLNFLNTTNKGLVGKEANEKIIEDINEVKSQRMDLIYDERTKVSRDPEKIGSGGSNVISVSDEPVEQFSKTPEQALKLLA